MNTEQERAELLPCPFCGGTVDFHQDDAECRDGCHYIECKECGVFDLSATADPNNQIESLSDLRDRIAPLWNRRAALQSQKPEPNDLMLSAVIRMPFEMAMADPISRMQFYRRAQQALNELEALQSQDREDAFTDGVLLACQMMTAAGDAGSHLHFELIETAGLNKVVRRAMQEGLWELAGLDAPMSNIARAAIDRARRIEEKK